MGTGITAVMEELATGLTSTEELPATGEVEAETAAEEEATGAPEVMEAG